MNILQKKAVQDFLDLKRLSLRSNESGERLDSGEASNSSSENDERFQSEEKNSKASRAKNEQTESTQTIGKTVPSKRKKSPQQPTPPSSPTVEETESKKYGQEYCNLNPTQQECRKNICQNWKKDENYERSLICRYHCQSEFRYDKKLDFLQAQEQANSELENHENICSFKNNKEKQAKAQKSNWDNCKKTNGRYLYSCSGCWGKVVWDKSIVDAEEAEKQASADLAYHKKHECGSAGTKKIAIYFSPNQGGNEHAPLNYAGKIDKNSLKLEKDNQGRVHQPQENINPKEKVNDYNPLLIGLVIGLVGIFVVSFLAINFPKKKKVIK